MELKLAGVSQTTPTRTGRLSILVWGKSGCGKTELATTLPGKKLWILFDPDGLAAVGKREDIVPFDMSGQRPDVIREFASENVGGLEAILKSPDSPDSIVFDSATSYAQMAMLSSIARGHKRATMDDPGLGTYQYRNRYILTTIRNLLSLTNRYNKHVMFICHEDIPVRDKEGAIVSITVLLGGSLPEEVPLMISEVWCMWDDGKRRMINLRPARFRAPCRTRMFHTDKTIEFEWKFNPDTQKGGKIADWYEAWKANEFRKINPPA